MARKQAGSLDTNVLLRLVLDDVPEQTEAVEKLITDTGTFQIADVTIIEMIFVLEKVYMLGRVRVVESIYSVIRHPAFNCNRKLFEQTLPKYLDNKKLSIVDCALTTYAKLNEATPLHTFDKELAKQYPDAVKLHA